MKKNKGRYKTTRKKKSNFEIETIFPHQENTKTLK